MNKTFDQGKEEVARLCQHFTTNRQAFFAPGVKKAHVRQMLIDPIESEPNLYKYADDNPGRWTDPMGNEPMGNTPLYGPYYPSGGVVTGPIGGATPSRDVICTFDGAGQIFSETVTAYEGESAKSACDRRAVGWGIGARWKVIGARDGSLPPTPPPAPKPTNRNDYLDCVTACVQQNTTTWGGIGALGNAGGNAGFGRYPRSPFGGLRHRGSPTTWQHRVCMGGRLDACGKFVGRVCVVITVFEGFYDIGVETACALICGDLYPGVDKKDWVK